MPRRRQSLKAQRKDKKRHIHNFKIKTVLKKKLKELEKAFVNKNAEEAKNQLKDAVSKLAKAAQKGIMHKNTAKRKISRLSKKLAKTLRHNLTTKTSKANFGFTLPVFKLTSVSKSKFIFFILSSGLRPRWMS